MDRQESLERTIGLASQTAKLRREVQRSVTALLDELAPERDPGRLNAVPGPVRQYRSPTRCVLQAASFAVSVSWFADAANDGGVGELHVIVWRGTVTRKGTSRNGDGASLVTELILRPITPPMDDCVWLAKDGSRYDTASLAAKCLALLSDQAPEPL